MSSNDDFIFKIDGRLFKVFERRRTEEGYYVIAITEYSVDKKSGNMYDREGTLMCFNGSELSSIHEEDIIDLNKEKTEGGYKCVFFTFISVSREEYISPNNAWDIKPVTNSKK